VDLICLLNDKNSARRRSTGSVMLRLVDATPVPQYLHIFSCEKIGNGSSLSSKISPHAEFEEKGLHA